jgi:hypothetical protein
LNYTVIVNPDSGPGSTTIPNSDFIPAIQQLNSYTNVRTIGYIPTNYGARNIDDVLRDVETYSGWSTNATGIEMHGIFFDEAPHEYTAEVADFMSKCNAAVKGAPGLLGDKTVSTRSIIAAYIVANNLQVIHNPGTIPDQGLDMDSTDITVIFEQSYDNYQIQQSALQKLSGDRSRYSYMIHTVPSATNLGSLLDTISRHAGYLFVTNRDTDYYQGFGSDWRSFTSMVPT